MLYDHEPQRKWGSNFNKNGIEDFVFQKQGALRCWLQELEETPHILEVQLRSFMIVCKKAVFCFHSQALKRLSAGLVRLQKP